jgi:hypothetical protein
MAQDLDGRERPVQTATRWCVIVDSSRANDVAARQALEELCRQYWNPLYAFSRAERRFEGFYISSLCGQEYPRCVNFRG